MKWSKDIRVYRQFTSHTDIDDIIVDNRLCCGSKLLYAYLTVNRRFEFNLNDILRNLNISSVSLSKYTEELKKIDVFAMDEDNEHLIFYMGTYQSPASRIKDLYSSAIRSK